MKVQIMNSVVEYETHSFQKCTQCQHYGGTVTKEHDSRARDTAALMVPDRTITVRVTSRVCGRIADVAEWRYQVHQDAEKAVEHIPVTRHNLSRIHEIYDPIVNQYWRGEQCPYYQPL